MFYLNLVLSVWGSDKSSVDHLTLHSSHVYCLPPLISPSPVHCLWKFLYIALPMRRSNPLPHQWHVFSWFFLPMHPHPTLDNLLWSVSFRVVLVSTAKCCPSRNHASISSWILSTLMWQNERNGFWPHIHIPNANKAEPPH